MLWAPTCEFLWRESNLNGRPVTGTQGVSITPGNNTKGSWVEILADTVITQDVYWIEICISSIAVSASAKDSIVDIGFDPTGGTTWAVLIADLFASDAAPYGGSNSSGGVWYAFPLFIKAGTALAARGSVNNATVGTAQIYVRVYGRPSHPELVRAGSHVDAFGIVAGSSRGTVITPGTTSEGAWTELTGAVTTEDYWYWQCAVGVNDGTMTTSPIHVDLSAGDASLKDVIITDDPWFVYASEAIGHGLAISPQNWRSVPAGARVYARAQNAGALDAAYSASAYAVRG